MANSFSMSSCRSPVVITAVKKTFNQTGKALAKGEPFDPSRLKLLESLAIDLSKEAFHKHGMLKDREAWFNFSFFEAYFSNYIEGTILTVEEAKTVIDTKRPLPNKRNDSHDVLGTFLITNDPKGMRTVPASAEDLMDILSKKAFNPSWVTGRKKSGSF